MGSSNQSLMQRAYSNTASGIVPKMSFFQSLQSSWNFGQNVGDFTDLENNIDIGDLLRTDTDTATGGGADIRTEKYQQQLDSVGLFVKPEDIIHLDLQAFMDLIKPMVKEHQDICKEIRRKGRNKIHALRCRQKNRDEVSMLQEQVERAKEQKRKLLEDNRRFQQNRDYMAQRLKQREQEFGLRLNS